MRILLTSPRAPVTLDLVRRFAARGDEVFVADSLRFTVAAFSRHCRFVRVPRPLDSPLAYVLRLQEIVAEYKIDWLIPTCEDVFFIAAHREKFTCNVFVDSLEKLDSIHDKWKFSQLPGNEFATVPASHQVVSRDELNAFAESASEHVFKPCYSRFASETLISPTREQLKQIDISPTKPWLVQRRIIGTEYSTYSVAQAGRLVAHACYRSKYRVGVGSGIYFLPQTIPAINQFVSKFVADHEYTGQLGFDCIVDGNNRAWIIEGNPRATSGVHLFGDDQPLAATLIGQSNSLLLAETKRLPMISMAMSIWGLATAVRNVKLLQFARDWFQGRDVIFRWNDPLPTLMLPLTMGELFWIGTREGKTLQQASTFDSEWNGESL